MIDRIYFEGADGRRVWPYEDYGCILKYFDAPPPSPKIYRVALEGRDGDLDMTEWAGDVKYGDRAVEFGLLDMYGRSGPLVNALTGRRWKLWKSDDEKYYYEGRCDSITSKTRKRVTNLTLRFTCAPFRTARADTIVEKTVDATNGAELILRAERKPVIPALTLTATCSLIWGGVTHALAAGTHTPAWLVLTDTPGALDVTGSGKITLTWRDGVL